MHDAMASRFGAADRLNPKFLLARAISSALSSRFVVDPSLIELALLREARIELRDVALRRIETSLPGAGPVAEVNGSAGFLSFEWEWRLGWPKNVSLTVRRLRLAASVVPAPGQVGDDEGECDRPGGVGANAETRASSLSAEQEGTSTKEEEGGDGFLSAYMRRQIERVLDVLTLRVEDFAVDVNFPADDNDPAVEFLGGIVDNGEDSCDGRISLVAGWEAVEVLSLGRCRDADEDQQQHKGNGLRDNDSSDPKTKDPPTEKKWTLRDALSETWRSYWAGRVDSAASRPLDVGEGVLRTRLCVTGLYAQALVEDGGADEVGGGSTMLPPKSVSSSVPAREECPDPLTAPSASSSTTLSERQSTSGASFASALTARSPSGTVESSASARTVYSILDSFSYSFETALRGRRFRDLRTGLVVVGSPTLASDLSVCANPPQIEAVQRLLFLLLSTKDRVDDGGDEGGDNSPGDAAEEKEEESVPAVTKVSETSSLNSQSERTTHMPMIGEDCVSTCTLSIPSVSIVLLGFSKIYLSSLSVFYRLDGSELNVTVGECRLAGIFASGNVVGCYDDPDWFISATGLHMSVLPTGAVLDIESIDRAEVRDGFRLTEPIRDQRVEVVGQVLCVEILSIEGELSTGVEEVWIWEGETKEKGADEGVNLRETAEHSSMEHMSISGTPSGVKKNKWKLGFISIPCWPSASSSKQKSESVVNESVCAQCKKSGVSDSSEDAEQEHGPVSTPFPGEFIACHYKVGHVLLTKADADDHCFQDVEVFMNPIADGSFTQIGVTAGLVENKLLRLEKAVACANVPFGNSNVIRQLCFGAEGIRVTAGFSMDEWAREFLVKQVVVHERDTSNAEAKPVNFPGATIAQLDISIAAETTAMEMKETHVVAEPYVGNDNTTSKDLITYYTQVCLRRVPNFISNVEVLGVDCRLLGFGVLTGGYCVIAAFDAVHAAVDAKKRIESGLTLDDFVRRKDNDPGRYEGQRSAILYDANLSPADNAENFTKRPGFLCCAVVVGSCACGPPGCLIGLCTALTLRFATSKKTRNMTKRLAKRIERWGKYLSKGKQAKSDPSRKVDEHHHEHRDNVL